MIGNRLIIYSKYKRFLIYFSILLQYTEVSHSSICSHTFNELKEQIKVSQQEGVAKPNTTTKHEKDSPSERIKDQYKKNSGSNKDHSLTNEGQLEEWLKKENSEISEFFKRHHTIISHSISTGIRTFNALVEPIEISSSERSEIKTDLEKYIEEMRKSSSLSTLMTQKLVFQVSQYLAANGITHTVTHQISIEKPTKNRKTQIYIEPNNDTPLGKLARDFYEKYNGGRIIYEPLGLNKLGGIGAYDFLGNTINLSESIFLDMHFLKNLTFLHELLHAKIHRDFEQTPDSPYHLALSGKFLLRNEHYQKNLSFSEMATYQQDIRILLRRLSNSSTIKHSKIFEERLSNALHFLLKTRKDDALFEDLKTKVNIGLEITESIEAALSIALRSLHEIWEKDSSKSFTTPYLNQPNFGLLNISFPTENFTLEIPFRNSEKPLEIEEVQRRLELVLKATQFHENHYFVVLFTLRRAERIKDREKRNLLLKALQASQILSQKFDPNAEEESLIDLEAKIETIYRQNAH